MTEPKKTYSQAAQVKMREEKVSQCAHVYTTENPAQIDLPGEGSTYTIAPETSVGDMIGLSKATLKKRTQHTDALPNEAQKVPINEDELLEDGVLQEVSKYRQNEESENPHSIGRVLPATRTAFGRDESGD